MLSLVVTPLLDVNYLPVDQGNSFTVSYNYSNASPRIVEQEVTSVIENHLSQITQLKDIYSVSNYGSGYVLLTFDKEADIGYKELEIAAKLRELRTELPPAMASPLLQRKSAKDKNPSPLLIYELTYLSDDIAANQWLSEQLIPALGTIPDIALVSAYGNRNYAWEVAYDPSRMLRHGFSPDQITKKIKESNGRSEIATIQTAEQNAPIFVNQDFTSQNDLEDLGLSGLIKLRDIASVKLVPDRITHHQRINGKKAIFINLFPHESTNRIQLAEQVKKFVDEISLTLPDSYLLQLNYDDTQFLSKELDKTWTRALLSFLVICLFILIGSRSLRYLVSLISSILVSIGMTLIALWILDITIHLYSLAGITIAAGILVDNAIILVDHYRKRNSGPIINAQLAASLTTVSALLVILVLPDEYRGDLTDFGWVITIALTASLLVSWFFTPAICQLTGVLDIQQKKVQRHLKKELQWLIRFNRLNTFLLRKRKWVIVLFIWAFGIPVFLLPSRWGEHEWYNQTIGSDLYQEELRPYVNKWLGGSLRLFYHGVYEKSSYRTPEKTRLFVNARLPYGHTLDQMNEIIRPAEEYLQQFDQIDKFVTQVYSGRYASITVEFNEANESGSFPYVLKNRLIHRSLDWGGVTWNIYGVGKGFSNATGESLPGFYVTLKGYHFEKLEQQAERLADKLLTHKRIQSVNTNKQLSWNEESIVQYQFKPILGVNSAFDYSKKVREIISASLQPSPTTYISFQQQNFPLYVVSSTADKQSLYNALHTSLEGKPLNFFGKLKEERSSSAIHKENRQYIRSVAFDYYGSHRFGKQFLDETIEEMMGELPPGFSIEPREQNWYSSQEKRRYELILVLMVLVFFIVSIFMESLREALIITLIIPLSYIGIFLTFSWGKFAFDQGGYAAFLMVGGLSINGMLYILSDFKSMSTKYPITKAMTKAVYNKAWPIFMTVLSTCAGLVPFLIHGEDEVFWFSLAIGTIGGLIFSMVISLFILPVLVLPVIPKDKAAIKA